MHCNHHSPFLLAMSDKDFLLAAVLRNLAPGYSEQSIKVYTKVRFDLLKVEHLKLILFFTQT